MQKFLKDKGGKPSLSRLLAILSWPPATVAMFHIQTEGALGLYLGAYATIYAGGKFADAINRTS